MNFQDLTDVMFKMWLQAREQNRPPTTVCVLGPPGVGKTSVGLELARKMTEYVQSKAPNAAPAVTAPGGALDLSSMLPEDLGGIPFRDGKLTRYCPQAWLEPFCQEDAYGVLILDDLPAASAAVQVACRQVSLTHRVHEMALSPGVFVMVTGNRREDKSSATTLPAHFRNSVVLIPFSPEFDGWEKWYMQTPGSKDVPAFLRFRPGHFSTLPQAADELGAFATPRTWSMLGNIMPKLNDEELMDVASGLVGKGVALELAAFCALRRTLVSPERVLADPKGALPDVGILAKSPDKMISMCAGLGEITAARVKATKGKDSAVHLHQYLIALAWVTQKEREYLAHSVATYLACGAEMKPLLAVLQDGLKSGKHPELKELIEALAKALA